MHREERKGCPDKLDIHPSRRHLVQHFLSQQHHPSAQPQGASRLRCPSHAGGAEEGERKGGSGSLGRGTRPLISRRQTGGVSLSRQAEGSRQPSLSAVRCHRHIKCPAELLSALTQRGSNLPNRNWRGQGQGSFTSCTLLLARIAVGVSWAAWLTTAQIRRCKGLTLLEFVSWQDTTPKHFGSFKPSLGTLRSEQEREKL